MFDQQTSLRDTSENIRNIEVGSGAPPGISLRKCDQQIQRDDVKLSNVDRQKDATSQL